MKNLYQKIEIKSGSPNGNRARDPHLIKDMSDYEFDDMLQQLMEERKKRKRKREKDFEM